jgi:hypothetical protein
MQKNRSVDGLEMEWFASSSDFGSSNPQKRKPPKWGSVCRDDPADFARFAYKDDRVGFSAGVDVFKLSDWFMVL